MSCFGQKEVSHVIVPYLTEAVTSWVTLQHTRDRQGLLKFLRYWFDFSESCHNPQYQLEKQHHISSSKRSMFAWLSSNSHKHSGYLLTAFKKAGVSVQCLQQAALQLVYKPPPAHGPSPVRDVHTPSLLLPQAGCFLPVYATRMMLSLIPLTVFSSQFLPAKVSLTSWTDLMSPSPCNSWAAHQVSQTSSSVWPDGCCC